MLVVLVLVVLVLVVLVYRVYNALICSYLCTSHSGRISDQFSYFDWFQINNAGIGLGASIEEATLDQFDQVMNTNMRSMYHLTMLAVPHLIASKGAIVNVSSATGLRAVSFLV